ncbi:MULTISPECIES: hypothetical protein [unclassified Aureimonas]|uniref:hypothetical protein n=1 Tax=unclassified Aureimonas TaxID=2615206 RepID=UPI00071FC7E5|nr:MULTISPECIES: hypothetical protein [unclassified Aureimonas]ALN75709.1 hypothetical protein M673_23470 [Aureimonas sp. AU20]
MKKYEIRLVLLSEAGIGMHRIAALQAYYAEKAFQVTSFMLPAGPYEGFREWTTHYGSHLIRHIPSRYVIHLEEEGCRTIIKNSELREFELDVTAAVSEGFLKLK